MACKDSFYFCTLKMEMCDEFTKTSKRNFAEAWLTDDRCKSWIRQVPSDNTLYHCTICNKNISCSTPVSRHMSSANHKNNIVKNSLSSNNDDNLSPQKRKVTFQQEWLDIEQFKCWLREVPRDEGLFHCLICDKSFSAGLSHIYRHAESKTHINKCKSNCSKISNSSVDMNTQINKSHLSFDERRKEAEIKYAALIVDKNISHQTAKEILSFFQHIGKDSNVLKSMSMSRTKCKNITNVLYPVETKHVVNKIQNTKFTICIDETSDKRVENLVRK